MRRPRQLRQNLFLHFAEPRLWLKLLQLTVKDAHSRAGLMAAPLQRSGEYDIFLKVVRLPSDQRWTFGTQVMSSCRINVHIPLTVEPAGQDISPGSHFAGDAARKKPLSKHAAPTSSGVLLCAKHNHLAPHSFTRYQPLISGCLV